MRWEKDKFEHNHPRPYPKWHIHSYSYIIATNFAKHRTKNIYPIFNLDTETCKPTLPLTSTWLLSSTLFISISTLFWDSPAKANDLFHCPYRHLPKDLLSMSWEALMKVCALRFFESVTSPCYFHQSWTAVSWFLSNS